MACACHLPHLPIKNGEKQNVVRPWPDQLDRRSRPCHVQNNAVFDALALVHVVKSNAVFQFSKHVVFIVGLRSGKEGSDLGQVWSVQVTA